MRHIVLADSALAALSVRVWRARGGYIGPLRIIAVTQAESVSLRLIDVNECAHTIASWTISDYADVPDAIRLIAAKDRNFTGLVFHERIDSSGCYWELVDPYTLGPSRMFARDWRAPYGEL